GFPRRRIVAEGGGVLDAFQGLDEQQPLTQPDQLGGGDRLAAVVDVRGIAAKTLDVKLPALGRAAEADRGVGGRRRPQAEWPVGGVEEFLERATALLP